MEEVAEHAEEMDLCLPSEFLDDDMFLQSREDQIPAATQALVNYSAVKRDEDDVIDSLSRRIAQSFIIDEKNYHLSSFAGSINNPKSMASSPQSTLSPKWSSSPPSTPSAQSEDEALELLYAAAGEIAVADLRLQDLQRQQHQEQLRRESRGLMALPNLAGKVLSTTTFTPLFCNRPHASTLQQFQFHRLREEQKVSAARGKRDVHINRGGASALDLQPSAWSALHHHHHHQLPLQKHNHNPRLGSGPCSGLTALSLNASNKSSTGTGVFLPKRVETPTSEPRKKSGCSTVLVPAKVVQALNLNLDELAVAPRFPDRYVINHDSQPLARRIATAAAAVRPNSATTAAAPRDEIRLPPEWTY